MSRTFANGIVGQILATTKGELAYEVLIGSINFFEQ
jgi:hypothetical protein